MSTTIEKLMTRMAEAFAGQSNQTALRDGTLIIGASDGPRLLARELAKNGFPITIVESDAELCRLASELSSVEVICGDPTDVNVIQHCLPNSVANVVVAMVDDELNLEVCKRVEMVFNPDHLIAVIHDKDNAIDFDVMGYEVMSLARVALKLLGNSALTDGGDELLRATDNDEGLREVTVSSPVAIGRHLSSLSLSDVELIDLTRHGRPIAIDNSTILEIGDSVTLFGRSRAVEAAAAELNPQC